MNNPGYSKDCDDCINNCQQCPVYWDINNIDPEPPEDFDKHENLNSIAYQTEILGE